MVWFSGERWFADTGLTVRIAILWDFCFDKSSRMESMPLLETAASVGIRDHNSHPLFSLLAGVPTRMTQPSLPGT